MKYNIKPYQSSDFNIWNNFVAQAKNATFLFDRNYMDYHQDRFLDASVMIYDAKNNLKALFVANTVETTLFSHQGLTYGGLLINEKTKLPEVIELFNDILFYHKELGYKILNIKLLPSIYTSIPAQEMQYILFLKQAKLYRRDTLSVINLQENFTISKDRWYAYRKAQKNKLVIKNECNFKDFWNEILLPNLHEKYNAKPVHTLEEIECLAQKFPHNIQQFNVYFEDKIVAGTTLYIDKKVIKTQYISSSEVGKKQNALDFLFVLLLTEFFSDNSVFKYFDFGSSNGLKNHCLNPELLFWKESFGARTEIQDFYELSII